MAGRQAVCVTRFDQSECVICGVISWKELLSEANYGEIFAFFPSLYRWFRHNSSVESCWNTQFILIAVTLLLNILLSCAFVTSLNCSVICWRPWWFECYIRRSSWIHCWLLLAVLSDYFFISLLQPFFFVNFGVFPGLTLLVFLLWDVESVLEWRDRLSQVAQLPGKGQGLETCWIGSRSEVSNAKSRKSLLHFKPEEINKFEYCNNLWKQHIFHNSVRKPETESLCLMHLSIETPTPPHPGPMWGNVGDCYGIWRHG